MPSQIHISSANSLVQRDQARLVLLLITSTETGETLGCIGIKSFLCIWYKEGENITKSANPLSAEVFTSLRQITSLLVIYLSLCRALRHISMHTRPSYVMLYMFTVIKVSCWWHIPQAQGCALMISCLHILLKRALQGLVTRSVRRKTETKGTRCHLHVGQVAERTKHADADVWDLNLLHAPMSERETERESDREREKDRERGRGRKSQRQRG